MCAQGTSGLLLRLTLLVLFLAACQGPRGALDRDNQQLIRIKGSDTMMLLVERWAEKYMTLRPGVSIYTEGGGSRLGILALINGTADICAASRPWQPDEIKQLVERRGSLGIAVLCAKDALSIYLNPENPVRNLSLEQIRGIFTGQLRVWSQVGGLDEPIEVLIRNPNSGTYLFLEQHVLLDTPYTSDATTMPTTTAIVRTVGEHRAAIGYGGFAYGSAVRHCSVDGVEPTPQNVRNGTYPISRYLYLYTAVPPTGLFKEFIDWVLSTEGQAIVKDVGYVPLYQMQ